jgi:hypothetical protein
MTPVSAMPARPARPARDGDDAECSWLAPGRLLHIPVGFVLVGFAAVIAVSLAAYIVGHRQGKDIAKQDYYDRFDELGVAVGPMRDPLLDGGEQPGGSIADDMYDRPVPAPRPAAGQRNETSVNSGPRSSTQWGPVEAERRESGLNYFVLMETHLDGAIRLVEFSRARGLETYVVRGNNARLRRVIVFPGFEGDQRTSPVVQAVETRIREVGMDWQAQEGGRDNLSGAYPLLYR